MNFVKIFKNTKFMLKLVIKHTPAYLLWILTYNIIRSLIDVTISVYLVKQVFNALENAAIVFEHIIISRNYGIVANRQSSIASNN